MGALAWRHGVRSVDTVRRLELPNVDPVVEAQRITAAEIEDVDGIVEISGARSFLEWLPEWSWGIVTSAPVALARRRLAAAGLPIPPVLITAEDVTHGKPSPDCFVLGAKKPLSARASVLVIRAMHKRRLLHAVGRARGRRGAVAAKVTFLVSTPRRPR